VTNIAEAEMHALSGAYVCDALGEDERAAFEAHMDQCPQCVAEVRALCEVTAIMAVSVSQRPPASLEAALDARIGATGQVPSATDTAAGGPTARGPLRRVRAGWAVAAALALLAVGLAWRTVDQQHQISALNAQATQISQLLAAPDAYTARVPVTGGGSALVVHSRSRDEVAVTFAGLSQAPAGKTYQLWLLAPDGSARSVGLMPAAPARPLLVEGLVGESKVGMTIEPAGGSAKPTTTPVMVAALGA
jgi:anti-sigma-K factor RskA